MFLMCLEINRLGWRQEQVLENPWVSDDEFNGDYDLKLEEIEDVKEIFPVICEELEKSNLVRFRVEGFGELPWPVDVSIDLMTVVEQLSDLLKFVEDSNSSSFCLDFYEQGIERRLIFSHVEKLVKINCRPLVMESSNIANNSKDSWGQYIEEEPLTGHNLKSMICNLITTFVSIAHDICPTLTSHKCFQEWCHDKYIANCCVR
ncbi:hypothetical protein QUA46_28600 [Microcoleus sp. MON2_D6]|uniref:hypothetical protein n=1 Tax=unclassified Microcoleus TaxID=2642155 RepID=UPI002FD3FAF6